MLESNVQRLNVNGLGGITPKILLFVRGVTDATAAEKASHDTI